MREVKRHWISLRSRFGHNNHLLLPPPPALTYQPASFQLQGKHFQCSPENFKIVSPDWNGFVVSLRIVNLVFHKSVLTFRVSFLKFYFLFRSQAPGISGYLFAA
jgi:hypothetical protein